MLIGVEYKCVNARTHTHPYIYIYIHIRILIYEKWVKKTRKKIVVNV